MGAWQGLKHQKHLSKTKSDLAEAAPGVFWEKKVFLKISKISQENNCVGVYFNKVAVLKSWRPAVFIKWDSNTEDWL